MRKSYVEVHSRCRIVVECKVAPTCRENGDRLVFNGKAVIAKCYSSEGTRSKIMDQYLIYS